MTHERILGVNVFNGTAEEAVAQASTAGGCVLVPASPALLKLNYDEGYRQALQQADMVLPDSGLLVLLWKIATGRKLAKISGIEYLKCLLRTVSLGGDGNALWVVPSDESKAKAIEFFRRQGFSTNTENVRVASGRSASGQDHELLLELEKRRPRHVVIAVRDGNQEKLAIYLRDYLLYRPSIHCVGAALGFLSGDEDPIPEWAQRHSLGWLSRLASQPGMFLPRLGIAAALAAMVLRYRSELPPLRKRWTDL